MKYLVKFILLVVTWPFFLVFLAALCSAWLIVYAWGGDTENGIFDFGTDIRKVAYYLWHFKPKK